MFLSTSHYRVCLVKLPLCASQAFLYGDNKKFNVTIVVPEMPELRAWAEKQGVSKEVRHSWCGVVWCDVV